MHGSGRVTNSIGNPSLLAAHDEISKSIPRNPRGQTMKENDQQIEKLKNDNFDLMMRVWHIKNEMEQRIGDGQEVTKNNIQLQVKIEKLKRDLMEKQVLIQKADDVQTLTAQLRLLEQIRSYQEKEISMLILQQKNLEIQILNARKETLQKDKDLLTIKAQLKGERADFEKNLHEQALKYERHACDDVAAVSSAANDVVLGYLLRSKSRGTYGGSSGITPQSEQTVVDGKKARRNRNKKVWALQEIARLKEVIKSTGPELNFERILKEFITSWSIKSVKSKVKRILSKDKTSRIRKKKAVETE